MPSSKLGQASITVRCTATEHKEISKKAASMGMSLSEYIRFVALNAEIKVTVGGKGE
jgi:predicted DNA binding CopG/RHH family protein